VLKHVEDDFNLEDYKAIPSSCTAHAHRLIYLV